MYFIDREKKAVFDNLPTYLWANECDPTDCELCRYCPMSGRDDKTLGCDQYACKHPIRTAKLMGYAIRRGKMPTPETVKVFCELNVEKHAGESDEDVLDMVSAMLEEYACSSGYISCGAVETADSLRARILSDLPGGDMHKPFGAG